MGTYDGYWDLAEKRAEERQSRLNEEFYAVRNNKGEYLSSRGWVSRLAEATRYDESNEAWADLIKKYDGVMTATELQSKGYAVEHVNLKAVRESVQKYAGLI